MKKNKKFYIICSLAIGDGCLIKKRNVKKAVLDIAHHIKHQDYIKYKANILESIGIKTKATIKNRKGNTQFRVYTNRNYLCYCVWRRLYQNKCKIFTRKMIRNLDEWSLAILWMDDGCLYYAKRKTKQGKNYLYKMGDIATQSFDDISLQNILNWLKKFGIDAYVTKTRSIHLNRNNVNKLIEIVSPFVKKINSMKYKIGL